MPGVATRTTRQRSPEALLALAELPTAGMPRLACDGPGGPAVETTRLERNADPHTRDSVVMAEDPAGHGKLMIIVI